MKDNTYSKFFSNLSNPLRVKIVTALNDGNKSVGEICSILKVEQSKVSHALGRLKQCSLVNVKQKGKERIYGINKKTLVPILKLIDKHAKENCKGTCNNCKCK